MVLCLDNRSNIDITTTTYGRFEFMNEELSKVTRCDCVIDDTHGISCTYRIDSMEECEDELRPYHMHHFSTS